MDRQGDKYPKLSCISVFFCRYFADHFCLISIVFSLSFHFALGFTGFIKLYKLPMCEKVQIKDKLGNL